MAGDAARLAPMRESANRAFGIAVLASLVLHAVLLATLPQWRELSALLPPEPEPLIARVERLEPPAAAPTPPAPAREIHKPEPRKPAPVAKPEPVRVPEPRSPAAPAPLPIPEPAPAPAPAPSPAPRIDMRDAVPPPAPKPDVEASALLGYSSEVVKVAKRIERYPRAAVDNNWTGEVKVKMWIGANGRIADLRVTQSSGYALLDRNALQMFENAQPLVPIPRELAGKVFDVDLRAIYNVTD
jgi:protein TonB